MKYRANKATIINPFMIANDAAYVLGRWQLRRDRDPLEGNFTLVFRHIDDRWLIVHDHTSLLEGE